MGLTLIWRNWSRTFSLRLSLAVVLVCALGSFGSPARATSGSAFNAFTSDVSLGPSRAAAPEKERKEQTPSGSTGQAKSACSISLALPPAPSPAARPVLEPRSAAPPVATAGAVGARAPPLP